MDGRRDSVLSFEEGAQGVDPHEGMALLMMTQHFDGSRDIAAQSNTILVPQSPFGRVRPLRAAAQCHYRRGSGSGEEHGEAAGKAKVRDSKVPEERQLILKVYLGGQPCGQENKSRGR